MFDKKILLQHMQNRERTIEEKLELISEEDPHVAADPRHPANRGSQYPSRGRSKAHIVPHHEDEGKHVYSQLPTRKGKKTIGLKLPLPKGTKMNDTVTNDKHLAKIKTHLEKQ